MVITSGSREERSSTLRRLEAADGRWGVRAPSGAVAEPFRNYAEQVLELIRDVAAGTIAGAVALGFRVAAASPEALGFPLLDDAADFPAAGIVLDTDTHVAEPFPAHKLELLASQLAGAVADVLGLGEENGVFSVFHSLVVLVTVYNTLTKRDYCRDMISIE